MKIGSIIIVGGGSAGWMTCAALCENLKNIKITLIESKNVKSVGVGESNIPEINRFLKLCNLSDEDFMSHCNATYKLSIKFNNFNTKNSFHYPLCRVKNNHNINLLPPNILLSLIDNNKLSYETFANYYHDSVQLAESNKMTFDSDCINDLDRDYVSYHFESHKFSEFLRERYKNKITYIVDDVVDFSQNEFGIDLIKCKNSGEIKADLYVDCTGFKSLLIKNFSKFKKYDTLKNNRAVVSPVEYLNNDKEMVPYTNCTALSSGWVWETPTWSRKGMGYVYSTDFISDDDAKNEFIKFIGREVDVRFVDIRSGVMEKGWCKNVVSIGLSYGFIEPLESTGLATTQEAILKLVNAITCRDGYVNYFDIEKYNTSLNNQITAMKNFTEIHYAMSDREDTPYWKYVTNSIDYSSDYLLGLFDLLSSFYHEVSFDNCFPAIYIFAGMGYSLNNKILDQKYEKNYYNLIQKQMCDKSFSDWVLYSNTLKKQIKKLKSHYEFLKENIYI